MSRSRKLGAALLGAALCLALVACTPDEPPKTATPKPTATVTKTGDGVLRVGSIFATTGAQSYLGPGQAAGVTAALADINAAGGVLGVPAEVLTGDAGDVTTKTMESTYGVLVSKGADVVVGPSSSVLAERVLPAVVTARVPLISPAATSVRLSGLDDSGYLFRTISSAAQEGTVFAKAIGKARTALVFLDDETGEAVLGNFRSAIAATKGTLATSQPFQNGTTDFAPIVTAVTASKPDAVVLVSPFSSVTQNMALITALSAAGFGGSKLWLSSGAMADYSQALPAGALTGVNGVLEGADAGAAFTAKVKAADATVTDYLYAAEAYDATILAALAATVADDDGGPAIAKNLRAVSEGGTRCTTYADCLDVLKKRSNIDYDGFSGPISFDSAGDVHSGHFGLYRYDAANRFARVADAIGG
ncbi:hypothetical protein BH09ACT1_BH09ACT1_29190 [soil metagenome]